MQKMKHNEIAVVIGGSKGIGAAIALALAKRGRQILLTYAQDADGAAGVLSAIRESGGMATARPVDVRRDDQVAALFDYVRAHAGHIDVLVNNAGVSGAATLADLDRGFIADVLDVNLIATVLCTARAVEFFPPQGGVVINVSSALATHPVPGQTAYAASKGAIDSATRAMAQELAPKRIRVNAVAPGPTATRLLPADAGTRAYVDSRTLLGRVGEPADIAAVVAFLASADAYWITGQIIGVDGGFFP